MQIETVNLNNLVKHIAFAVNFFQSSRKIFTFDDSSQLIGKIHLWNEIGKVNCQVFGRLATELDIVEILAFNLSI